MLLLKNSLWERPEQRTKVAAIVKKHAQDALKRQMEETVQQVKEVLEEVQKNSTPDQALEATKKLKMLNADIEKLAQSYPQRSEINDLKELVKKSLEEVAALALGV
ncbi:hypothetical protein D3C81_1540670 [compost metagenome]